MFFPGWFERAMKTLARQMLDVVNKTRSNPENVRGWRGQFTPKVTANRTEAQANL